MPQNSKKTVEAIVRVENVRLKDVSPPWSITISDSWFTDVRIYPGISDEEIGLVMLAACLSSSGEIIRETASDTLAALVTDEGFVLSGGLLFRENGEVKVSPGCCGGLESWNEWFSAAHGNTHIWTGHSPESLVEIDSGIIKIWHDREDKDDNYSIEFSAPEMIEKLQNVELDLKNFLFRLAQWTKYIEPGLESEVVRHFEENMNIKI
jgi:hypothetical protein